MSVTAVREAIEMAATKYCSVSAMLAAGETVIHHRYRVIGTGAVPLDEAGEVRVSGPFARAEGLCEGSPGPLTTSLLSSATRVSHGEDHIRTEVLE